MATPEPPDTLLRVREAELLHRLGWYRVEVVDVHMVLARDRDHDGHDDVWPDAVVWVRPGWWWPRGSCWLLGRLLSSRSFRVEVVLC